MDIGVADHDHDAVEASERVLARAPAADCFEEERGLGDRQGATGARERREPLLALGDDQGMEEALQGVALVFVREDQLSERLAVDPALVTRHGREGREDRGDTGAAGAQQLPHEGIRVEEILLSGGGILAPGAVTYIEQAAARVTRTWNPLEGLRIAQDRVDIEELEAWAPSLVVAVGLASRVRAA